MCLAFLLCNIHGIVAQTDTLLYPIDDFGEENLSNLDFSDTVVRDIEYNPETGQYNIVTKIGDVIIDSDEMTVEEYQNYSQENDIDEYWKQRVDYEMSQSRSVEEPDLSKYLDTTTVRLFNVEPRGNIGLNLGFRSQNVENPTLPVRQRKTGALDMDMNIQMQVQGSIADRLNFDANYNTESNFLFSRDQFNVGYQGKEDDILQSIEFGNVALPLRSSLIKGNQSLLGVKSTVQFGRLTATAVLSQQLSRQEGIQLQGGKLRKQFEIKADEYQENQHFFLGHYFRDRYDEDFETLPQLNTPYNITRLQVWVTNQVFQPTNVREFAAFTDLAEFDPSIINNIGVNPTPGVDFLANNSNDLYNQLTATDAIRQAQTANGFLNSQGFFEGTDYEMITARQLAPSEYEFNPNLGFISLNNRLAPEEVLAVAFEYTDINGNVRRVGEFSENLGLSTDVNNNQDQVLILKLLKPRAPRPDLPTWDLMMKNIYSLGAFQIDQAEFRLDVYYNDPGEGLKRYLPVEDPADVDVFQRPILQVLRLDQFNQSQIRSPDGVFDFLPGYTIDASKGRLIFPVVEPFGDHLRSVIDDPAIQDELAFDELYDLTQAQAELFPEFNRFNITGSYQSSVQDQISLGAFNLPEGSVTVRAGGRQLVENVDYSIDYNLGRLKILNPAIVNSGAPIDVQFEDNLQLGFQSKRLAGTRLDYFVNNKLGVGATIMNMQERPFTNKVNLGDDPISNTVLGADVNYQTKSGWLTRAVDKIPFIDTKEESSINLQAEYAYFIPGHAKQIGRNRGQVYIDDFEGSSAVYDLKFPTESWAISSTPQRFPEFALNNDRGNGFNRANISWYNIDPLLNSDNTSTGRPASIGVAERSDVYARQVLEREVFPNIVNEQRVTVPLPTLDISYYPNQRGPYNFNTNDLNADGTLQNPQGKWGGIMRGLTVTDFQAANVEFVEFWLMDPFINTEFRPNNSNNSGKLVINLGNISEDILKDGRMFFENGLPEPGQQVNLVETNLGRVPTVLNINNAFAASEEGLRAQDVGYDGLDNEAEITFFDQYLTDIQNLFGTGSVAYQNALQDPAADDFQHFLGEEYDSQGTNIVDRYQSFTRPQGNTSSSLDADNTNSAQSYNATNTPDSEDINRDNTLERSEAYYEYEVDLNPSSLQVGQNFIVSKITSQVTLPNGNNEDVDWYQFKVPISGYTSAVNNIQGFQSMRFIRMYLTEFPEETTLRFARLNLLRNEWRRYEYNLDDRNQLLNQNVGFNVFPINIEEDQNKQPFPYVLPPGIQREELQGAANSFLRNEQSLAMNICSLPDDDARGIYKLLNLDIRQYENLEMFVHAEQLPLEVQPIDDDDFELIIRIGSDFSQNYYEYKQPLLITPQGSLDPFSIWPEDNNVNISLKEWVALKNERNLDPGASPTLPYSNADGSLTVLGTPDLGRADFVMIAVRNIEDDKLAKCVEVWVNELRVTGLNQDKAHAALAQADIQLADFGSLNLSGNMHTAGYGSIEQRVDERFRDDFTQYDVSGNFNLDKFLPAKSTVKIPVFASYSKSTSKPQYSPYETDVELKDAPQEIKDALKDQTEIATVNVTNLRKERNPEKQKTPKIYDVENFNASFSYTQQKSQSAIIAEDINKTYYGALGYNFNPEPKPIRPFYSLIKDQKYLQWAKEFNFNPIPSNLSFRTDMTNRSQQTALRDIQEPTESLETFYFRDWTWNRNYDLDWDLTNSINVQFQASNQSRIDTPDGPIDTQVDRDSVWTNLKNFGRSVLYNHNVNASYKVPFSAIPILDFMNAEVTYNSDFNWLSAPLEIDQSTGEANLGRLGNAIRNNQGIVVNSSFDFDKLYNKSGFLGEINGVKKGSKDNPSSSRTRQRPGSQEAEKPDSTSNQSLAFLKPLLSLKRLTVNYTQQRGTFVPGFTPTPDYLGLNASSMAPGLGFVFGEQVDRSWLQEAANNNWITKEEDFSYQFLQDKTQSLSIRAGLQPIKDMNIDVNLDYSKTDNYSELFRNDGTIQNPNFESFNPYQSGAYNISFISLNTLFQKPSADGIPSVFRDFEQNRIIASQVLGDRNPNSTGAHPDFPDYREGYGPYSQEVILAAFTSAYTGKSVSDTKLNPFKTVPLPNWSLNYSGLTNIPFFSKHFRTVTLKHTYTSSYSINQYNSNLLYEGPEDYFLPTAIDVISNNYQAFYYIPQVLISESFSPLAGIQFNMNNGMQGNLQYNKTRQLGLSLLDYQLSENNSTGFSARFGYQTNNFKLPFKLFGKSRVLENNLMFNLDFTYQDDVVTNYKLDQNTSLPTRGAETISILPTIDYVLNERLNLQLYLDRRKSTPKTQSSYPVGNTRGGMRFTYTFIR